MKRLLNCGALQSGGGFNPATSATISEMFSNGSAQKHVSIVREHYRTTCQILLRAVEEHMKGALKEGETLTYERPTGGFFVFIRLPERFDADRLLEICQRLGVVFFVGKHSSLDKQGFRNCIRLCFAWLEPEVMIEGVKRIAKGLREY